MIPHPIKFSIIIPAYNYAHYLPRAIDSVFSQTYPYYEIVIIDDGSTDNTRTLLEGYCHFSLIKIISQSNQGVSAARNKGVKLATGDYCLFLDADDALTKDALEILAKEINHHSNIPWVAGASWIVQDKGVTKLRPLKSLSDDPNKNFISYLKHEFSIPNGSIAISKIILQNIEFPENLRNCEDFVFCAQLLGRYAGVVSPKPVLEIYKHSQSLRNNLSNDLKTGARLVSCLFRSERLPEKLRQKKYKRICLALRLLDIFRGLYLAKKFQKAKRYYKRAIKCYFPAIFYFSYFRKYLKISWMVF